VPVPFKCLADVSYHHVMIPIPLCTMFSIDDAYRYMGLVLLLDLFIDTLTYQHFFYHLLPLFEPIPSLKLMPIISAFSHLKSARLLEVLIQ
jgi:hypothetical protein